MGEDYTKHLRNEEGLYLCLLRDVPDRGFKCVEAFGEHFIAARAADRLVVDRNLCPHRSFPVAEGSGQLPIHCPYHGLPFSPAARFTFQLPGGFILLNAVALPTAVEAELFKVGVDLGNEFFSYTQHVAAPFYLWVQNTMDPNHLKTVHGGGFAELFHQGAQPEAEWYSGSERASGYRIPVKQGVVERYEKMAKGPLDPYFRHFTIFPHLSVTSFLGVFYSVETAVPMVGGCKVLSRFFTSTRNHVSPLLTSLAREANHKILIQDKIIIERWAITYDEGETGFWMKGEERIQRYLRLLKGEA